MTNGKLSHVTCGYFGPNVLDGRCPNCMVQITGRTVAQLAAELESTGTIVTDPQDR